MRDKVPYKIIIAAKNGDAEAMQAIFWHYQGYIAYFSRRSGHGQGGEPITYVDEDIRERIEATLMYAIVSRFDAERPPNNSIHPQK